MNAPRKPRTRYIVFSCFCVRVSSKIPDCRSSLQSVNPDDTLYLFMLIRCFFAPCLFS